MRTRSLLSAAVLAVTLGASSCVVGSPPGFGDGDVWTVPLVNPLEDDVLLVPVSVQDKGPFLFLIDPDSNASSIDNALVSQLDLYSGRGPEELTEADNQVPTFYAEVPKMEMGNLTVRSRKWRVHKAGTYWVGGRVVRGVIGRDIIADSLMFAIDRDRGILQLGEQGKISTPAGASKIGFDNHFGRRVGTVEINGSAKMKMSIDFGGRFSRLWEEKIAAAKLPKVPVDGKLVDEYGAIQRVTSAGIAAKVMAGGESVEGLMIVPFGDKRIDKHDLDGSLGLDFFSRFSVVANWHKKSVWISKRNPDLHASANDRLGRWSAVFAGCATPGCLTVSIGDGGSAPGGFGKLRKKRQEKRTIDPSLMADPAEPVADADQIPPAPAEGAPGAEAPAAAQPSPTPGGAAPVPPPLMAPRFRVERTAGAPELAASQRIEVLLDAVNAEGISLGLPRIQVALQVGANLIEGQLPQSYAGAANLKILDITPLGRKCEPNGTCFWMQTR